MDLFSFHFLTRNIHAIVPAYTNVLKMAHFVCGYAKTNYFLGFQPVALKFNYFITFSRKKREEIFSALSVRYVSIHEYKENKRLLECIAHLCRHRQFSFPFKSFIYVLILLLSPVCRSMPYSYCMCTLSFTRESRSFIFMILLSLERNSKCMNAQK